MFPNSGRRRELVSGEYIAPQSLLPTPLDADEHGLPPGGRTAPNRSPLAPPSCSSAVRNGRRRSESGDDDVAPSLEANPLTSHLTATDSGPYHRVKPQSALG